MQCRLKFQPQILEEMQRYCMCFCSLKTERYNFTFLQTDMFFSYIKAFKDFFMQCSVHKKASIIKNKNYVVDYEDSAQVTHKYPKCVQQEKHILWL